MRHLSLCILATAALAVAAPTVAFGDDPGTGTIPPPHPILTHIDKTPLIELSDGGGGLPYLGSATSYNAGDWENALRTFHDSGVYDTELGQIDSIAQAWVQRFVHAGSHERARHERAHKTRAKLHRRARIAKLHGRKLAIVLDIDETSLSNYSAINADNFTFGPNSQAEAVNKIGVAIKPTLDLFNLAKKNGVAVFLITGRREAVRQPTTENLQEQGFSGWDGLILKPDASTQTTVTYKSGARATIEQQGYRIIANVGDQYSDLAGGHEDKAFKLPNPFYFLP
jgi:predicted secreted acid phosphatase